MPAEARRAKAGTASEVVLAVTVAAVHTDGATIRVGRDDRVQAVGLADATEILERLARVVAPTGCIHGWVL